MNIEPGRSYKTRSGQVARIYATDGTGEHPVHGVLNGEIECWDAQGHFSGCPCGLDLIEVLPGYSDDELLLESLTLMDAFLHEVLARGLVRDTDVLVGQMHYCAGKLAHRLGERARRPERNLWEKRLPWPAQEASSPFTP